MTSPILRKRSEKVVGANLPSQWARVVFSNAPSRLYSQEAGGILGVSEEKVAALGAAITFQPLPKHQVPASVGAPRGNPPARSMALQETEKGNQNFSTGKPSRELSFQALRFLPSLISHQILPCIMHLFGAKKLYFYIILTLVD